MPADERYIDLRFPLGGLDLTQEFQEQKPETTPVANNVRTTNPGGLRQRGGSRAGLIKYIEQQAGGEYLIQHLNVIVDPQNEALRQNFTVPGDDWVEDPNNPGKYVPPGGWGNQGPATPEAASTGITKIQVAKGSASANDLSGSPLVLQFDSTVAVDDFVLVYVLTSQKSELSSAGDTGSGVGDLSVTVSLEDEGSNSFTQIGSYAETNNEDKVVADSENLCMYHRMSVWRLKAGASFGDSVSLDLSTPYGENCFIRAIAIAYRNVDTTNPVGSSSLVADSSSAADIASIETGSVTQLSEGALVGAVFGDTSGRGSGADNTCDIVDINLTYSVGFGDLSADPGESVAVAACQCDSESTISFGGSDHTIANAQSLSYWNSWFLGPPYNSGPNAVSSVDVIVNDPGGCSGSNASGGMSSPSSTTPSMDAAENSATLVYAYNDLDTTAGATTVTYALSENVVVAAACAVVLRKAS